MDLRVLLVEDDPAAARLVREMLSDVETVRFAVTHVESLQQARGALQSQKFDAVLLDLILSDSSGFETFAAMNAAAPHVPIVVLTSVGSEEMAARALRDGAQDYLVKRDVDAALLSRTIRHAIERRRFEEALVTSEARYRSLIEGSIQGILIHRHGVVLLVNRALAHLVGAASPDELIGAEIWPYILPEDQPLVARMMRLREDGQPAPTQYQFRAVRRDGRVIWLECVVSSIRWDGASAVLATIVDVTERHQAEDNLRESEARFRQLADNIKEAFIILELPDYKALYLSRVWEEIWGFSVAQVYRDPQCWLEAVHPDDRALVPDANAAIERGESVALLLRLVRRDGSRRWVRARLFPVRNEQGLVYRAVGLIEDITELRHTEERLLRAQKMESVGRLAGGIAHDFNNLLVVVIGYTELVLRDLGPSHPSVENLRPIQAAAQSAAALTRQLLAFSRRQLLQPQVIDLNEVVQHIEPLLGRLIGEDIELTLKLTTPLAMISADPGQIEQVVMNLAVNARDAMPDGGRLTIETSNVDLDEAFVAQHPDTTPGRHAMIAVSDTGVGMDEETQAHLFEPFFTTKEPGKGTGLGLATVYGIVKQSRGSIWVYSEPDKGTTVKIYLPATEEQAAALVPLPEPASLAGTETVLVVEDQSDVRAVIRETLQRHGYTVLEAASPPEAFAHSREYAGSIHLLLMDVVLAGMSGRMVAEGLAARRTSLRTVFMSGYTNEAIAHHGIIESGVHFIQKPFSPDSLLRKIREALDA